MTHQNPPRGNTQSPKASATQPSQRTAPPSDPKKAVPDGFTDPTAGIVFPTRRRRPR